MTLNKFNLPDVNARIGVAQPLSQQPLDQTVGVGGEITLDIRKQDLEQLPLPQYLEAALTVPGQKKLQGFVEQPRGRHAGDLLVRGRRAHRPRRAGRRHHMDARSRVIRAALPAARGR